VQGVGDFVVITGMSGAGRSEAGNTLEDLGWFVIDNLPPTIIPKVAELALGPSDTEPLVAFAIGAGLDLEELNAARQQLQSHGDRVRVLFLDANDEVLIRRYESNRRRHPFAGDRPLHEAIQLERERLRAVREAADLVIDTSNLTVHDLKARLIEAFHPDGAEDQMQTTVVSFGYKHGLPSDVDLVIDCRFLPNPYWDDELRPLTGLDEPVKQFLAAQELTGPFLERLRALLELLVPAYRDEGKAYLTIALGCTGGRHRSVAMAEEVGRMLESMGVRPRVSHRDVAK
jgi:UPF0042 nucleotide-binding protein